MRALMWIAKRMCNFQLPAVLVKIPSGTQPAYRK
jgi:hypothetical protein